MNNEIPQQYRPAPPPANPPASAVTLEWLGTASFRFTYKGSTLLIDPHVSRPGVWRTLLLKLYSHESLCAEYFPAADHILVGHSHCDHLLDVPAIARRTGAAVLGSKDTAAVCRVSGVADLQIRIVQTQTPIDCGPFRVTFIPSIHGRALFGRIPYPGHIENPPAPPLKTKHYRHGDVYGLLVQAGETRFLHLGSADFIDEEIARAAPAHVLIPGIAGRQKTPDYLKRLTSILRPHTVLACHYDNFFKPIKRPMTLMPGVGLDDFIAEANTVCPDKKLILPAFFGKIVFDADSAEYLQG